MHMEWKGTAWRCTDRGREHLQPGVTLCGVWSFADVEHLHELQHERVHAGKLELDQHGGLLCEHLVHVRSIEVVCLAGGVEGGLDVELLRAQAVAAHNVGEW